MPCTNDLTPIIVAVATIITFQVPIVVGALLAWLKASRDRRTLKQVGYETKQKVEELTLITKNGFHGPPGPTGPAGPAGPPAA